MLEIVVALVALVGVGWVALKCHRLERRLHAMELAMVVPRSQGQEVLPSPSPLSGLRISLAIQQDHPHAVFANLLKEALLKEDVSEVLVGGRTLDSADLLIQGELICNGYAEIYYRAEFSCCVGESEICTLIERPPHGDRPGNLAIELVTKLKVELEKATLRDERRQAVRELGG